MNTFKINTNSWHYKFQDTMETYPNTRTDFCSYWRGLVWAFFKVVFAIVAVTAFLVGVGVVSHVIGYLLLALIYHDFLETTAGFVVSMLIGIVVTAIIAAIPFVWDHYKKRWKETKNIAVQSQPSILKTKYRAWKDKVCYKVEFIDE